MHTRMHIYPKTHVYFKYVYLQIVLWKKRKKVFKISLYSNVWNSEDSNAFLVKLFDVLTFNFS
jgi:hypothetical protein